MKNIFFVFALIPCCLYAQKLTRDDKKVLENLTTHISFLADDSLEGRRAGTKGETIANKYIQSQFEKAQLKPMGDNNGFLQSFPISDGKNFTKSSFFIKLSVAKNIWSINSFSYMPLNTLSKFSSANIKYSSLH
jgi:hypothetical protein